MNEKNGLRGEHGRSVTSHDAHRELHGFVAARLSRPRDIDALAQEVHVRLGQCDESGRAADPLEHAMRIAACALTDLRTSLRTRCTRIEIEDASSERARSESDDVESAQDANLQLQQLLERALSQLPTTHAAILLAHKRGRLSYEDIAERLNLSLCTVEKYVSQASALLRTFAVASDCPDDTQLTVVSRDELFVAQEAAHWLGRLRRDALDNEREEFLRWVSHRRLHVRELLLAATWSTLLSSSAYDSMQ